MDAAMLSHQASGPGKQEVGNELGITKLQRSPVVACKLLANPRPGSFRVLCSVRLIKHQPVPLDTHTGVILGRRRPAAVTLFEVTQFLSNDLVCDQHYITVQQVLGVSGTLRAMVHKHLEAATGFVCQLSSPLTNEGDWAYHQSRPAERHASDADTRSGWCNNLSVSRVPGRPEHGRTQQGRTAGFEHINACKQGAFVPKLHACRTQVVAQQWPSELQGREYLEIRSPSAVMLSAICKGRAGWLNTKATISTVFPSPISSPGTYSMCLCPCHIQHCEWKLNMV